MRTVLILGILLSGCGPSEVPVLREPEAFSDGDLDGYTPDDGDCNDDAPAIHPNAVELCDGLDNNCDQIVDGGLSCVTVDTFDQQVRLDVLFVVDNSLSMAAEQARLRAAAPEFVPYALEDGGVRHDTHIGVITTDMDDPQHGGRLVAVDGSRYVNASMTTEEAVAWVEDAVAVGTSGSTDERARDAMQEALLSHTESENQGFFRQDAYLTVFVVSDEDDVSSVASAADFTQWLFEIKGDGMARVNAIVGPEYGCPDDAFGASHIEVVTLTLGTMLPICNLTYDGYLEGASQEAVNGSLQDRFVLSSRPDGPLTVEVLLEDGSFASNSPLSPSDYDYADQSMTLILGSPIAPGRSLRVTYMREP